MRSSGRANAAVTPRLPSSGRAALIAVAGSLSLATLVPAALGAAAVTDPGDGTPAARAPARLRDTGLYSDPARHELAPDVIGYTPQYPLWSDGAVKRRWIRLPPGAAIDASDPDAWVFPIGTKVWKEFSFGRRVETRYIERARDGTWIFAAYAWTADGSEALLAPERGIRGAAQSRPGVPHDIPSELDCHACHEGGPTPILGFSALQLSPDRDPLAPHAERPRPGDLDLPALVARGLVRRLPATLLHRAPRVRAESPVGRAALGYLHANCGICHDARGPLSPLGLSLVQPVGAGRDAPPPPLPTAVARPSRYRPPAVPQATLRVRPGRPEESVVVVRMASRNPLTQMPPLGTHVVDDDALAVVRAWIDSLAPEEAGAGAARITRP